MLYHQKRQHHPQYCSCLANMSRNDGFARVHCQNKPLADKSYPLVYNHCLDNSCYPHRTQRMYDSIHVREERKRLGGTMYLQPMHRRSWCLWNLVGMERMCGSSLVHEYRTQLVCNWYLLPLPLFH
jgi:hypothetical protein